MSTSAFSGQTRAGGLDVMAHRLRALARLAGQQAAQHGALRVLWSGSRVWADQPGRWTLLNFTALPIALGLIDATPRLGFMHGCAPGLDTYINELLLRRDFAGVTPELYPVMPGEDPLDRDRRMIENKPGMVIGLPHRAATTGGTWECLRQAYGAGIPTYVCRDILGVGWRFERFTPRGTKSTEPTL